MLDLSISCIVFELEYKNKIQLPNKKTLWWDPQFLDFEYKILDLNARTKHAPIN